MFSDRYALSREQANIHLPLVEPNLNPLLVQSKTLQDALAFVKNERVDTSNKLRTALKCKLWRLNNLYSISSKEGKHIPFIMNYAQWKVYLSSIGFGRVVILKSRQQGISTFWLISLIDDCIFNKNMTAGLISFGRSQTADLFDRMNYTWDSFNEEAKKLLGVKKVTRNRQKELSFNNHSKVLITNDFRGNTLQRLHISELGHIALKSPARADEIITGDLQTLHHNSKAIVETTAKGENKLSDIWNEGEAAYDEKNNVMLNPEAFRPIFLSFLEDPACSYQMRQQDTDESVEYFKDKPEATQEQKNFWIAKYSSMGELVFREYPATPQEAFLQNTEGTVYSRMYINNVKRIRFDLPFLPEIDGGPYNPAEPIYVSFDLGINDPTFMVWFQAYKHRLTFLYEKHLTDDEAGMDNISRLLHKVMAEQIKPSNPHAEYKTLFLPHDVRQRTAQIEVSSRLDTLISLGWSNYTVTKPINDETYANVKSCLRYTTIDLKACPQLDKAFRNLIRKRDNIRDVYLEKVQHDDYSHPMDAVGYGVDETYKDVLSLHDDYEDVPSDLII